MTDIIKAPKLPGNALDPAHYTESLLTAALHAGLCTDDDGERIRAAVLDVLAAYLSRLTNRKSCTVRTEVAQIGLCNVLYVLDLALLSYPTPDDAADALRTSSLSDLYEQGQRLIRRRLRACELQYRRMLPTFSALPESVFRKTAVDGMAAFFSAYQPDLWPCEIHITADYPLYVPCDASLTGISFIAVYLQRLTEEATFLSRFKPEILRRILLSDDKHYQINADNLFRPVFATVIGMLLLKKPFPAWKHGLSEDDLSALAALTPREEDISAAVLRMCDLLMLPRGCSDYCRRAAGKFLSAYRAAQNFGVIRRAFPCSG